MNFEKFLIKHLGSPEQFVFALIKFSIRCTIVTYIILLLSINLDKEFFRFYIVALTVLAMAVR
jgi:hypothetical protein